MIINLLIVRILVHCYIVYLSRKQEMFVRKTAAEKFNAKMIEQGKEHHVHRINKSHEIIEKVSSIYAQKQNTERVINYLKKIDPYVFEEMILSVLERKKIKIQRNTSYSGDGGIDGIFHCKKGRVLIQCKRYSNYINYQDVKELADNVNKGKFYAGLFVHTGNTGKASTMVSHYYKNVIFLQDDFLAKFVAGEINIEHFLENEYKALKATPTPEKKALPFYRKKKKFSFPSFKKINIPWWKLGTATGAAGVGYLHFSGIAPIPFDAIWYTVSNFPFAEIANKLQHMYGT